MASPLQYSCMENPMDRGAWRTLHRVSRHACILLSAACPGLGNLTSKCLSFLSVRWIIPHSPLWGENNNTRKVLTSIYSMFIAVTVSPWLNISLQTQLGSVSVQNLWLFSCCPVVSDSLRPHGLQLARLPCPSPTPGACSNSCASSRWCHPTISSSVVPFSSRLQSCPASGSFPVHQFFSSGGQNIGSFGFSISPPSEYSGLISWESESSVGLGKVKLMKFVWVMEVDVYKNLFYIVIQLKIRFPEEWLLR